SAARCAPATLSGWDIVKKAIALRRCRSSVIPLSNSDVVSCRFVDAAYLSEQRCDRGRSM
ncbi:MAG: hypothetical protein O3A29_17435, partial [Planctomycetota bacterium]|nr:hypothetical protein [Planctomycetota bacterium]